MYLTIHQSPAFHGECPVASLQVTACTRLTNYNGEIPPGTAQPWTLNFEQSLFAPRFVVLLRGFIPVAYDLLRKECLGFFSPRP